MTYISKEDSPVTFYTILSLIVIVVIFIIFFGIMLLEAILVYSGPTFLLAVIFGIFSLASKNKRRKNELKKIAKFFIYSTVAIMILIVICNLVTVI